MCDKAVCTLIHTHAGMYVLQWREESREDRARDPVPSPISVMRSTPPPLAGVGVCRAGGVPYHIHCIGSRGLEVFMRRKASQRFYSHVWGPHCCVTLKDPGSSNGSKRFSFAKEIFVWKSKKKKRNLKFKI